MDNIEETISINNQNQDEISGPFQLKPEIMESVKMMINCLLEKDEELK